MHRCFIDNERWHQVPLIPSKAEAHHIQHVLRVRDGETIRLFNGHGDEAVAVVRVQTGDVPILDIQDRQSAARRAFDIVLLQAVLKGNRMEMLIEKATELGVGRIIPVMTARVIPRFNAAQAKQKRERWERVAISAAKQCGTPWLPRIDAPTTLTAAVDQRVGPLLLASLEAKTRPLAQVIDDLRATKTTAVTIVIGPEGDLTTEETQELLAADAIPVSLGALILRAETAAIYTISALGCMLQENEVAHRISE